MEKKFKTVVDKFESSLWGYHLPVNPGIAEAYKEKAIKRVICVVNDKVTIHSAILSTQGYFYILLNKQNVKKLGARRGEEVTVHLKPETAKYGLPMPEEMQAVMEQDESGKQHFDALTPGKQRSLIYLVSKVKNTDSRIAKALAIFHHLNENDGEIDYHGLSAAIKRFNRQKIG